MEDQELMGMGMPPEGEMAEPMAEEAPMEGMEPLTVDPMTAQSNYGSMGLEKQNMVDLLLRSPVAPVIDELLGQPVMATLAGTMGSEPAPAPEEEMPMEGEGMMAPAPMADEEEAPAPLV